MNKQELIERMKGFKEIFGNKIEYIELDLAIELASRLDEHQKVVVPQFVADWLEKVKNKLFGLNYDSVPSEIYDWVYEEEGNLKKLHIACVIGYTVEKEKRYRVKVKGMNRINGYLAYNKTNGAWYFGISGNSKNHSTNHTRKELENAGFSWAFDCEGVEIEEVE